MVQVGVGERDGIEFSRNDRPQIGIALGSCCYSLEHPKVDEYARGRRFEQIARTGYFADGPAGRDPHGTFSVRSSPRRVASLIIGVEDATDLEITRGRPVAELVRVRMAA